MLKIAILQIFFNNESNISYTVYWNKNLCLCYNPFFRFFTFIEIRINIGSSEKFIPKYISIFDNSSFQNLSGFLAKNFSARFFMSIKFLKNRNELSGQFNIFARSQHINKIPLVLLLLCKTLNQNEIYK